MSSDIFERNFLFFNVLPFSPGKEKELAADAVDYMKQTGNDLVLYCMTLHPQGFPAMKKAEALLLRRGDPSLREALRRDALANTWAARTDEILSALEEARRAENASFPLRARDTKKAIPE